VDAAKSPTLGDCEGKFPSKDYFRYWHGSQIVAKPVFLIAGLPTLRIVVFFAFLCAFLYFALSVGEQFSWLTAGIAGLVILTCPLGSRLFVAPYASSWIIGFVAAALQATLLTFVLAGIAVAYFYLFNNPIVVPTAALFALTLMHWRDGRKASPIEVLLFLLAWFVGYAGFWLLKWLLAGSVLGFGVVAQDVIGAGFVTAWREVRGKRHLFGSQHEPKLHNHDAGHVAGLRRPAIVSTGHHLAAWLA
jgi:hypothetical protein